MLVIALAIVFASSYLARSASRNAMTMDGVRRALLLDHAGLVLVFLALPILIVVPMSFSASPVFSFPPQGFSLRWYYNVRNAELDPVRAWPVGADRVPCDLHLAR